MSRIKEVEIYLPCELSDHEQVDAARKIAIARNEQKQFEDELGTFKKQMNAKIAEREAIINANSNLITSGVEYRNVPCRVAFDFDEGLKRTVRTDTNAEVRCEPITEAERQAELDLPGEGEAAEPAEDGAEPLPDEAPIEDTDNETEPKE